MMDILCPASFKKIVEITKTVKSSSQHSSNNTNTSYTANFLRIESVHDSNSTRITLFDRVFSLQSIVLLFVVFINEPFSFFTSLMDVITCK